MTFNNSEITSKLAEAISKINEVRQNLADWNVSDELLTLLDEATEEITAVSKALDKND